MTSSTQPLRQTCLLGPTALQAGRKSAFMLSSVGARFRRQLAGLMSTLSQCQPHYIRWAGLGASEVVLPGTRVQPVAELD